MKGIVLAGGSGTRLHPATKAVSKQLIPVYSIRDILIISTPDDLPNFKKLLGDGSDFGVNFVYKEQPRPEGIAQAFLIGREFIGSDSVCLILGDNIFHGSGFKRLLNKAITSAEYDKEATIFGYYVEDPERYGVAEFDKNGKCISIEEKPTEPKSNYAVVGLYFYPNNIVNVAETIEPSARGELEITTVNQAYLDSGKLNVEVLGSGFSWLDTGTQSSLLDASNYVAAIEKRQGLKIACLEEIAYKNRWITKDKLTECAMRMKNSEYGKYLLNKVTR